ncbi:MAG: hypothetical protein OEY89_12870 [Gammaproteobacteria bacterium]|nr:hypothetical protein [Gammaproteobacteria bacterium]
MIANKIIPEEWRDFPLGKLVLNIQKLKESEKSRYTNPSRSKNEELDKIFDISIYKAIDELVFKAFPNRIDYRLFQYKQFQFKDLSPSSLLVGLMRQYDPIHFATRAILSRLKIEEVKRLCDKNSGGAEKLCSELGKRLKTLPENPSVQEQVLNRVCLPYVHFMFIEIIRKAETGIIPFNEYKRLINKIHSYLERSHLCNKDPRKGLGIPGKADELMEWDKSLPWPAYDTWMTVAMNLIYMAGVLSSLKVHLMNESQQAQLKELAEKALIIAQCGWLTLDNLKTKLGLIKERNQDNALNVTLKQLEKLFITTSYILVEIEKFNINSIRSSQYAWCALQRNEFYKRNNNEPALEEKIRETLERCVGNIGIGNTGSLSGSASTPSLFGLRLRQEFPELELFFLSLDERKRYWDGFNTGVLSNYILRTNDPVLIRLIFRAAIRSGNLRWVRAVLRAQFHDNLQGKMRRIYEGPHGRKKSEKIRNKLCTALTIEDLFLLANAVASIAQKMAPMVGPESYIYRESIRSLWKRLPQKEKESLTDTQKLYLHHVLSGLSLHGLIQHPMDATWMVHETLSNEERDEFVEEQINQIRHNCVKPFLLQAIDEECIVINRDEVFVSLVIRDHHEISLVVVGPNQTMQSKIVTTSCETDMRSRKKIQDRWIGNIDKSGIFDKARMSFDAQLRDSGIPTIPNDLIRLLKAIFQLACKVNPKFSRLFIHTLPMFRQIPWQYIFQTNPELCTLRENYFSINPRKGSYSGHHDFSIWHIPGIHTEDTKGALSKQSANNQSSTFERIHDQHDDTCKAIDSYLQADPAAIPQVPISRLSIIAHGQRSGDNTQSTDLIIEGEPWDRSDRHKFGGYQLTVLHTCGAGLALRNPNSDYGGIPGWLLGHGSRFVLAASVVIPIPTQIEKIETCVPVILERYLAKLESLGADSLEANYMKAVREEPICGLYNLTGWENGPVLMPEPVKDSLTPSSKAVSEKLINFFRKIFIKNNS